MVAEEDEELDLQQHDYYEVTGREDTSEGHERSDGKGGDSPIYSMIGLSAPTMCDSGVWCKDVH